MSVNIENKTFLLLEKICHIAGKNPEQFMCSLNHYLLPHFQSLTTVEVMSDLLGLYECSATKGKSLLHENGFTKISLFKCPKTNIQFRLHIWPRGSNDSTIHNHRWNLWGYCIKGLIEAYNYDLIDDSLSNLHLYKVYDANGDMEKERELISPVKPKISILYRMQPGDIHFLNHKTYHKVMIPEDSCTLFVSGPPIKDYSHVVYKDHFFKKREIVDEENCKRLMRSLV